MAGRDEDPFKDPSLDAQHHQSQQPAFATDSPARERAKHVPDTLAVGRNASLTLGTDSLIVLDEALRESRGPALCCGFSFIPGQKKTTRSIPFHNILWAEVKEDGDVVVRYAHIVSKKEVRPAIISYELDKTQTSHAQEWVEKLLDRAYGASQRRKRIKVLLNPFGGQGKAKKMYHNSIAPILEAAQCELDLEETQYNGHAIEIGQNLDIDAYDVVACCSGDGIPHEVWNGLAKKADAARALAKVAITQMPCGSGNAASLNFNGTISPSLAAVAVVKGLRTPLDLTSITQGDKRTLSFCSQAVGIVAEVDLATEDLRWMGSARFTYGFLVRLIGQTVYPADIAVKIEHENKPEVRKIYRAEASKPPPTSDTRALPAPGTGLPELKYGTSMDPLPEDWEVVPHDKLGNFYAGNLAYMSQDANFFPAALPNDGSLDLIRIDGTLPRLTALKTMLSIEKGTFFDQPHVKYDKVSAYRFVPKHQKDGYISIDGEKVPFEGFQAEVHRGLGTVLTKTGHLYEAKGV